MSEQSYYIDTTPEDEVEYARTEKISWQGTFSFFQLSLNVGNRKSDAWLLNELDRKGGIYTFVFFYFLYLYISTAIAILNHW